MGPLLIHASKTYNHDGDMYLHSMPVFADIPAFLPSQLPKGAIIGKVWLDGYVRRSESRWFFGPFGWVLCDPKPFDRPIPYKGQLRIFDVTTKDEYYKEY